MIDLTAAGAYGYKSWSPANPGGTSIIAETQLGANSDVPGAVMSKLPFGPNNPLFWVLVLVMLFTGWLYLGAEFGVRKVGGAGFHLGRK